MARKTIAPFEIAHAGQHVGQAGARHTHIFFLIDGRGPHRVGNVPADTPQRLLLVGGFGIGHFIEGMRLKGVGSQQGAALDVVQFKAIQLHQQPGLAGGRQSIMQAQMACTEVEGRCVHILYCAWSSAAGNHGLHGLGGQRRRRIVGGQHEAQFGRGQHPHNGLRHDAQRAFATHQ